MSKNNNIHDYQSTNPELLVFGAGCIGRGLLGELASKAGWHITFVEANKALAAALKTRGQYKVKLAGRENTETLVHNYNVIQPDDANAIKDTLSTCTMVATSVGGQHLASVAKSMASHIKDRKKPLPILLCENWPQADRVMADALINEGVAADAFITLPVSVERMVRDIENSTNLIGESGETAWIDSSLLPANMEILPGLNLCQDLTPYYARKLFTNNAGHAVLAYEGFLKGYKTLPEALVDNEISERLIGLLKVAVEALSLKYGLSHKELTAHTNTLIKYRYANTALADTVERVARQPIRKLGSKERLAGLLNMATQYKLSIQPVCRTIAAALHYHHPDDKEAQLLQQKLQNNGIAKTLRETAGILPESEEFIMILKEYNDIKVKYYSLNF